ncbi:hypothetical protein OF83DRAFT_1172678 [Amylostereum chailletii]|nr:hypothetical protein OF83DRAFT_1172678 [Amylostereum chailletii]
MADTLKSVFECMSTTPSPPVLPTLGELSFLPTFTPSATPESLLPSPTELPIINEKNIHAVARKTRHLPAMVTSPFTEMISDFQDMWSDPTDPSVFSPDLPRLTISLAEISPPPFVFDIEADAVDDVDDVAMYEGEDVTPYYPASIPSSPELSFSCSDSDESIPSSPDSAILALPVAKQYRRGLPSKPSQPTGKKSEKRTRAREDDDNDDDYLPKRSIIHKRTRRSSSSSPPSAPLLPLASLPDVTPAVALSPRPDRLTAPLPRRARQCATACGGSPPPPNPVKTNRGSGRKAKAKGKGKAKSKGKHPFSCPDCKEYFTRVKDAVRHWTFTCKRNLGRLCVICPGCKKNLSRPDAARRHQTASQCQGTGEIAVLLEQIRGVMSVTEESIRAVAARVGAVHDGEDAESIEGDGEED